jgi:TetR/AcrR family transcriptional regulator, cholesterol catabolism regulator
MSTLGRPRGRPRKLPEARDEGNRRQELLHAAARLFREHGFAATSTRDIAAAVGMQSGSPFYHFKSKDDLLNEVMVQGMRWALAQQACTVQQLPSGSAPDMALRALIRTHFEILLGPNSDFIPVMLYEWRSLTPAQRQGITALQHDYEAAWLPVLQTLHAAGRLRAEPRIARLLMLGALNWSVQWYRADRGATLDELSDAALALFIHR